MNWGQRSGALGIPCPLGVSRAVCRWGSSSLAPGCLLLFVPNVSMCTSEYLQTSVDSGCYHHGGDALQPKGLGSTVGLSSYPVALSVLYDLGQATQLLWASIPRFESWE